MATRTYHAIGLGWATLIALDGEDKDSPVVLTSKDNTKPHCYVKSAAEAERVFGVVKGPPCDNMPDAPTVRSFSQDFPPETLNRIKVESAQFYAEQFAAADAPSAGDDASTEPEAPKAARRSGKKSTAA